MELHAIHSWRRHLYGIFLASATIACNSFGGETVLAECLVTALVHWLAYQYCSIKLTLEAFLGNLVIVQALVQTPTCAMLSLLMLSLFFQLKSWETKIFHFLAHVTI